MKFKTATDKINWCIQDIHEFTDLIDINNSEYEFFQRYELCKEISGQQIKNRIENLLLACWSAKDWIIKDIKENISIEASKEFENEMYTFDSVQLVQYLADSIKHGGIDPRFLNQNKFKSVEPVLGKTFLKLYNNSFPGRFKPSHIIEGDSVPPFKVEMVFAYTNGVNFYNFDTVILSVQIIDKNNVELFHAMGLVFDYVEILTSLYSKYSE